MGIHSYLTSFEICAFIQPIKLHGISEEAERVNGFTEKAGKRQELRLSDAFLTEEAVERAVEESIQQDILKEFLLQNKAEVTKMSIFEYDEEAVKQAWKEDAYEDGWTEGKRDGMIEGITQGITQGIMKGKIQGKIEALLLVLDSLETSESLSEELQKRIREETDANVLEQWLRTAGRVKSVEEFRKTNLEI